MHSTISSKCTLKHCSIKSAEVSGRRPHPLRPQPSSTGNVCASVSTSMQGLVPPAQIAFLAHFIATVPLTVTGQCPNWREIASEGLQVSLFFFSYFPSSFQIVVKLLGSGCCILTLSPALSESISLLVTDCISNSSVVSLEWLTVESCIRTWHQQVQLDES
ncbi:hypothetical protein G6F49_007522 [Rhizopus delemar]|nr:hypothetical protein G6F54_008810 [Rhizopus delemar]KAG1555018.1 hypothetical protein G6F49_007522 [Rhizopus delemar]KAG1584848.1 hypothetical protein G6F48_007635 [Rhizopus delemar]KAG1634467.1 hypothetical protein G6F44_010097 [Rhizopus delemar]